MCDISHVEAVSLLTMKVPAGPRPGGLRGAPPGLSTEVRTFLNIWSLHELRMSMFFLVNCVDGNEFGFACSPVCCFDCAART